MPPVRPSLLVIRQCGLVRAPPDPAPDTVVPADPTLSVPESVLDEFERRGLLVWAEQNHPSKGILDDVKTT